MPKKISKKTRESWPHVTEILRPSFEKSVKGFRDSVGLEKANAIISAKADFGIQVHEMCEKWNWMIMKIGHAHYCPESDDPKVQERFNIYRSWAEKNIAKIIACEQKVFHDDFRYQGKFDLLAIIKGDPYATLIDFKTAATEFDSWGPQIHAYLEAFTSTAKFKKHPIKIGRCIALQITDRVHPIDYHGPEYFTEFLRYLVEYRKTKQGEHND
jgi:hypothetical protein